MSGNDSTTGAKTDAERMTWWLDARFGLFVHFGAYAQRGFEPSWPAMQPHMAKVIGDKWRISTNEYLALADTFNPEQFDPHEWVRLAKDAGQKYIVFTTKHHDGYCMWDTAFTPYKITNSPYGKDFLRLLADACEAEDMPLGLYYSPPDWHHPGYRDQTRPVVENWRGEPTRVEWMLYLDYMECQIRELLTRYGKIAVLWWDGLFNTHQYDPVRFSRLVRELQPDIIINDRLGGQFQIPNLPDEVRGDYLTPEGVVFSAIPTKGTKTLDQTPIIKHQDVMRTALESGCEPDKLGDWPGMAELNEQVNATVAQWISAGNPERRIPSADEFRPWETCMSAGLLQWSWGPDEQSKSTGDLVRQLIDIASKGGNLLLNLAITPEGKPDPKQEKAMRGMGDWLRVNGEAIYGTTYGPLQDLQFGRTTAKGKTVYLHVFDWPADGKVEVKGELARVRNARLVADGASLTFSQEEDALTIEVPERSPTRHAGVIALETGG